MGWDLRFLKTEKIGTILDKCKDFKLEKKGDHVFMYKYLDDGSRSGIFIPYGDGEINDAFLDECLGYACANYATCVRYVLYDMYKKLGITFADTELDAYYYLCDDCENEDEERALADYSVCREMTNMFGDLLEPDDWLFKRLEETTPVYERVYQRYKQKNEMIS